MLKVREVSSTITSDEENNELMEKMHNAILLCLGNEVLRKLQLKLESLYMTKSLIIHFYLKKLVFTPQMKEGTSIKDHIYEF